MRVERIKLMMRSAAVSGERRLDVVEFIAIARALDADPIKLMMATLFDGVSKKPKRGA